MVAQTLEALTEASPDAEGQAEAAALAEDEPATSDVPLPTTGGPQLHVGLRPEAPDAAQPAAEVSYSLDLEELHYLEAPKFLPVFTRRMTSLNALPCNCMKCKTRSEAVPVVAHEGV